MIENTVTTDPQNVQTLDRVKAKRRLDACRAIHKLYFLQAAFRQLATIDSESGFAFAELSGLSYILADIASAFEENIAQ